MLQPLASTPAAPSVVLCTLNAKYIHASLGLRYLLANMGPLRACTVLCEFTIARRTHEIADELLLALGAPAGAGVQVIGFGVYIWNVAQTCALVRLLRQLRPELKLVLGGPEVSHELEGQEIVALADHVVTGWGDISFPRLCQSLLYGPQPLMKVIAGEQPPLAQINLPYAEYTAADLAHRVVYVEASRGCPFKCEFCLSSLDKTAWAFDLDRLLDALAALHARGARNFKFVDRTFNLKIDASLRILQFFLDRLPAQASAGGAPGLFAHFEVIPDHLPGRLKEMIARFPAGVLQFEVGIQTFNVDVQRRIARKQDNDKTVENLRWLVRTSHAHLHADLIFGLPGESLQSFALGFDRLYALRPHEIQLGMLKRLRGTPIARHSAAHGMVFDPAPPYTVRETAAVSASDVQRFTRLARYWDLLANSGRFKRSLVLLLEPRDLPLQQPPAGRPCEAHSGWSAFDRLLQLSDWLWAATGSTSRLTPEMLVDQLFTYLRDQGGIPPGDCRQALLDDYLDSGARARPSVLRDVLPARTAPVRGPPAALPRQQRHRNDRAARPQAPASA